ncbi:MAG: polysaccharide deacetylase family protein [Defluviitaleaceae bacterium]|nr:polysaccharide deacetylase family protein [Defluviitaleaceae bacterium]
MRSKFFWLAVLGFSILAGIISCVASDSASQSSSGSVPAAILPDITDDYEYNSDETGNLSSTVVEEIDEPPVEPGELDIQTENFFIAERYVGFLTWGYFSHPSVAAPVPIIDSSVYDSYTGEELGLTQIIDTEMTDQALTLLANALLAYAPEVEPFLYSIDKDWLTHIVLDTEGLKILLAPDITPWDLGFVSVIISYEDLDDVFLLHVELGLREPPRLPMIALTFDDGPSIYTGMILDILEAHGGNATFCVLGNRIHYHPGILRRAVEMGSEVIGHSWDHSNLTRLNANAITNQITRTSTAIEEATGQAPPPIFRAPYGLTNTRVVSTSRDLGYALLHWSVDPQDWYHRDADVIYNNIMSRAIDGSIVVAHDIRISTVEAMERVIPSLIEEGFQLVTASELIAYFYGELEPGDIYQGLRLPWGSYNGR